MNMMVNYSIVLLNCVINYSIVVIKITQLWYKKKSKYINEWEHLNVRYVSKLFIENSI